MRWLRLAEHLILVALSVFASEQTRAEVSDGKIVSTSAQWYGAELGKRYSGGGTVVRSLSKAFPGFWGGVADVYAKNIVYNGNRYIQNVVTQNHIAVCIVVFNDDDVTSRHRRLFDLYKATTSAFGRVDSIELTTETTKDDDGDTITLTGDEVNEVGNYRYGYSARKAYDPNLWIPTTGDDGSTVGTSTLYSERFLVCDAGGSPNPPQQPTGGNECFNGLGDCPNAVLQPQ